MTGLLLHSISLCHIMTLQRKSSKYIPSQIPTSRLVYYNVTPLESNSISTAYDTFS